MGERPDLLLLAHLVIAAVVVVGCPDALRAVVRFVFKVAERECPCAEAVLLRFRFACDDRAFEVGVLLDVDVETVFPCEEACLLMCAAVVGFQAPLADRCTERGLGEGAEDFVGAGRVEHLVHAPGEVEARCLVLLLVDCCSD